MIYYNEVDYINEYKEEYFSKNLEKWGKSPETNILFITGFSGSGKSTLARDMANKYNDIIISLDDYSEVYDGFNNSPFREYLLKNMPNYFKITRLREFKNPKYWECVDKMFDLMKSFAAKEFKKKHRVIVEGLQIMDGWLCSDLNYYKTQPIIVMNTSFLTSSLRATKRTFENNCVRNANDFISAINQPFNTNSRELKKITQLKNIIR